MEYIRYHYHTVGSTNDYAKELLVNHDFVIVTADYQTEGRGRSNKNWYGDAGQNIYYSLGINHENAQAFKKVCLYQAIGTLAVKQAISEITRSTNFYIKYPNDLYTKDKETGYLKKLCGVLAEHSFIGNKLTSSVIGIGINVNQISFPSEVDNNATSLRILGFQFEPEQLIEKLSMWMYRYLNRDEDTLFNLWKNELNIVGKLVRINKDNSNYVISNILPDGRLLAKKMNAEKEIIIDNGDTIRYDIV